MKKITLEISEVLLGIIEKAVLNDGFHSRSEFLRFLIVTYSKENKIGSTDKNTAMDDSEEKLLYGHPEEDYEFGIPLDVIKKIEEEARKRSK